MFPDPPHYSRRAFLASAAPLFAQPAEPVIDIHQHTDYSGRSNAQLIAHQDRMGIAKTVLLPAGSRYGLEASAGGNESCLALVKEHPGKFAFFANEVAYDDSMPQVVEKYLKLGAIGIGEQKFFVDVASSVMDRLCQVARANQVPVLLHFQHERYNVNFDLFHRVLSRYPTVNFIGHAQTWWANIDAKHVQEVLYPKWPVTPGGYSDRWLRDYPNMYGDLSAGSGLNALLRDEAHAREFLARHEDKLLYGSDCNDSMGVGPKCSGSQQIAAVKRLAPNAEAARKMLYGNAKKLLKL